MAAYNLLVYNSVSILVGIKVLRPLVLPMQGSEEDVTIGSWESMESRSQLPTGFLKLT